MNSSELPKASHEKDLGITIIYDLKPIKHCSANKLSFIGRTFGYKYEKVTFTLFNALVRLLEYCTRLWLPYYKKDTDKLERIQRKVTKIIPRLRNKPYEERLKELTVYPNVGYKGT